MSKVFLKLQSILARQFSIPRDNIQPEARFKEELGADSRDFFEILAVFEETFKININSEDAVQIFTINDAFRYIEKKLNKKVKNN